VLGRMLHKSLQGSPDRIGTGRKSQFIQPAGWIAALSHRVRLMPPKGICQRAQATARARTLRRAFPRRPLAAGTGPSAHEWG